MKKAFVFTLLATILTSCVSYTGVYKVGLQEVETPKNMKEPLGGTKIVSFQDQGKTKYKYDDNLIDIVWQPFPTKLCFSLTNKSDSSIMIIWDEAVYVDENSSSHKVLHAGIRFIDRTKSLPPTVIIKGTKIDDMVQPTDYVYFDNNLMSGHYGQWMEFPLFKYKAASSAELSAISSANIGKVIQVLLPIKIGATTYEYLYKFKVEDFVTK